MSECADVSTQTTPMTKTSMVSRCLKALLEMVTGKDNKTHDLGRWSWLICTISVLAHDAWQLSQKAEVNVKDLAFALAAIVAAHGVALGLKASTEPTQEQP